MALPSPDCVISSNSASETPDLEKSKMLNTSVKAWFFATAKESGLFPEIRFLILKYSKCDNRLILIVVFPCKFDNAFSESWAVDISFVTSLK